MVAPRYESGGEAQGLVRPARDWMEGGEGDMRCLLSEEFLSSSSFPAIHSVLFSSAPFLTTEEVG